MQMSIRYVVAVFLFFAAPLAWPQQPQVCDVDVDGDVDINDIRLIFAARNTPASGPDDPRDPDRNGFITVNDGRICTYFCTLPGCAEPVQNALPVANAGNDQTVTQGDTVTLDGSASSDSDGDPLTFSWRFLELPLGSAATLSDPTSVMPSFSADLAGDYVIELVVNDGNSDSAPDDVVVVTSPGNTAPVANAGPDQTVQVNDTVQLDGSASSDDDGDRLSYFWTISSAPAGSVAALSDASAVMPTFVADVPGNYTVELVVDDGLAGSFPDNVTITTENTLPVANAGPDQSVPLAALVQLDGSGSSDVDGNALTFAWSLTAVPAGSAAVLGNAGTDSPTFVADAPGTYVAQLIVNDGFANSAPDTVVIDTRNSQPVAEAGPNQTAEVGETVQLDGSGSFDADGDLLSYSWSFTAIPAGSAAVLSDPSAINPAFDADEAGLFVLQLIVNDGQLDSDPDTTTVTVEVAPNSPPQAIDDQADTSEETALTIDVLANDIDDDGDTLTVSSVTQPANGVVVNNGSDVTYTPVANFTGIDTFTYTADDGNGGSDSATVTVDVGATNDDPVANDDVVTTDEDVPVSVDVLANDQDDDGDTLSVSAVTQGVNGTVTNNSIDVTYTPNADFNGSDTFAYTVSDGNGGSANATVTVTVTAVNDDPAASDDNATTDEDTAVTVDVLANDDDVDGDSLTIASFSQAANGTVAVSGNGLSYTPNADFNGSDSFTYTIDDGNGGSGTATVNVTVVAVNDDPVANDDSASTDEDTGVTVDVLANDDDVDGDGLTIVTVTQGASGTVTNNGADLTYAPDADFNGSDSFTYSIDDGNGGTDSATVTVTVDAVNDPPQASAGPDQVLLILDTLQLDGTASSDPDGDTLAYQWSQIAGPAGGIASFSDAAVEAPTVTFNEAGNYVIQLQVDDGSDTATDTLGVTVQAAPVLTISDASVAEGDSGTSQLTFTVAISAAIDRIVSVDFATADNTATLADSDYEQASGSVSFPANSTAAQSIAVTINGDTLVEPTESFFVNLSAASNATIGDAQGIGTLLNDDAAATISLSPAVLNLQTLETGNLTVTISDPAAAGGQVIDILVADTAVATAPANVVIPGGASSATFTVSALSGGTTSITASASGFSSDSSSIVVAARTLTLTLGDSLVGVGRSVSGTVLLSEAAPTGGVVVTLASDDPGIATVTPPSVSIPAGQSGAAFQVGGVAEGSAQITAAAAGYNNAAIAVQVTANLITTPINLNVPLGQTTSFPVSITPDPAPAGGVIVSIVSSDPGTVEVLTPTITIPAGLFSANATVRGTSVGDATVSASSPTFADDSTLATTTAEFNIVETSLTFNEVFANQTLTIQLRSQGNAVAAPEPVDVVLTSSDPTCVASPGTVTIQTGFVSVESAPLQYGGTAALPCSTQVTASDTTITPDSVNVTVQPAPGITLFSLPFSVGAGLQDSGFTARLGASQHGGVTMRLESSDPTRLLLAPNGSTPGSPFIEQFIPNGSIDFTYAIQGVEGALGDVTVTASATGFNDSTGVISVVQPAVRISGLFPSIDTLDPDDPFQVQVGTPSAGNLNLLRVQAARIGGGGLSISIVNSDASVGELVTQAVTGQSVAVSIAEGSTVSASSVGSGGVAFRSLGTGTTVVTASGLGFVPVNTSSQTVTVTAPGITMFSLPVTVGAGLQTSGFTARLGASQHGGVTMRIESSDPSRILVAPNESTPGTPFIEVPLANGLIDVRYVIQAVEGALGDATLTASASGFDDGTGIATAVQPGVRITGLLASIDTLDPDDLFQVQVGVPNFGNATLSQIQSARAGGGGISVSLSNSNPLAGELETSGGGSQSAVVLIPEGVGTSAASLPAGGVAFSPAGTGVTVVSATVTGFVTVDSGTVTVNVTAPGITLFSLPWTLGAGLQDSNFTARLGASQHGGVTMRLESSNPAVLRLAPDANTPGTAFIERVIPNGQVDFSYTIQGMEGASGSVAITATAIGFNDSVGNVNVVQSALRITSLGTSIDTLDVDDPFFIQVGVPNTANNGLQTIQEARTGGGGLTVTVSNSESTVGELVTTAATGQSVTVTIPEALSASPSTTASGGVAFSPLGTGNTVVSAGISGFAPTDAASQPVQVNAPGITLFSLPRTLGAGLQDSNFTARLGATQHGGVTMRLESSNPSVLLLAPDGNSAGAGFLEQFIPNGQSDMQYTMQGLENVTGTVTITASAPGFVDEIGAVSVVQPALRLSGPSSTLNGLGPDQVFTVLVGTPNFNNSDVQFGQEARVGGGGLTASVFNSNSAVAQLVTSGGTGQSVAISIPEGASSSPTSIATGGVALDGIANGTTLVNALIPNFIATGAASRSVTVFGTFEIPLGQQNLTQLPGTVATSSSDFSSGFVAALGIDESNNSSWCSANNDPAPSFTVDFAAATTVSSIQMFNTQFNPTYSFLTGTFRVLDGGGAELFNSGVVPMSDGGAIVSVSPAAGGARTVVFDGATWNSIEPCLSEFGVIGTSP